MAVSKRVNTVLHDVDWLQERHDWLGPKSVVMVESIRETGNKIEKETRHYISSLALTAARIGPIVRGQWAIESSLHWVMDMVFRDDDCRVRAGNAAAWDDEYLVSLATA